MFLFPLFSIKSISLNTQGIIDWMRKTECSHSVTGKYGENCVVTKLSPVYFPFACVSLASRCKLGLEVLSTVIITAVNSMCGLVSEHRKHPCSEPGPLFPDSELVLFHHSTNKVSQLFHTWLQWHSSCFCSHQAKFNLLTYCIFWTTYTVHLFICLYGEIAPAASGSNTENVFALHHTVEMIRSVSQHKDWTKVLRWICL